MLVPAAVDHEAARAHDPLAGGRSCDLLRNSLLDLRDGPDFEEVEIVGRNASGVGVSVNQPRQGESARQIDDLRAPPGKALHGRVGSNRSDTATLDGHRLGDLIRVAHSYDLSVQKDQVRAQ
jgi:hypothetical protein